jgi:hypothetical protein
MYLHNKLCRLIVKYIISEMIPGLWTLWTDYGNYEVLKPLISRCLTILSQIFVATFVKCVVY